MKLAISATCSDGYVIFLDHLIKSILRHNPEFNKDFLIFCDGRLRKENRKYLTGLYKGFIFKDVDYNLYQEYGKSDMRFYSLECFNQRGYDRIIFWGADMLCWRYYRYFHFFHHRFINESLTFMWFGCLLIAQPLSGNSFNQS